MPADTTITARAAKKRRHRSGLPLSREFRRYSAQGLEVRSADTGDGITITGMPIMYNAPYSVRDMFGEFTETMHPGVVTNILAGTPDVRFLFNHDGMPLARSISGTLTLEDTRAGLSFNATLDARQSLATDLAVAVERGDVSQMSCGFVVGLDSWNDEQDERDIYRLEQLFDVSAVTYPASPTTSVELAYRAMTAAPIESRARVRKLWAVAKDFREGNTLTAETAGLLKDALETLHEAVDPDVDAVVEEPEPAAVVPDASVPPVEAQTQEPAAERSGIPATAAERRAAAVSDSFSDIQSALYQALQTHFAGDDGDETLDLWVQDAGTDWVVWNAYGDAGPGVGMWRLNYSIDDDMVVTLIGDPQAVAVETSYVPVERAADPADEARASDPGLTALALEAEQLRLRGKRHTA